MTLILMIHFPTFLAFLHRDDVGQGGTYVGARKL